MSDLSTTKAGWRVVNTACSDAVKWKVITSQYHGGWKASQLMTAGGNAYASVCGVQEKTVDASSWYDLCGWLGAEYLTSQVSLAVDVSTSSGSGMFFAGFVEECNSDEWSSMTVDAYKHTGSGLVQEMVLSLDRSIQVFASVEKCNTDTTLCLWWRQEQLRLSFGHHRHIFWCEVVCFLLLFFLNHLRSDLMHEILISMPVKAIS